MAATSAEAFLVRDGVVGFDDGRERVAILSQAPVTAVRPGVIILSAGVIHRIGPHRLHVILARRLAARGFPTVRLDVGGVGDTPIDSQAESFQAGAVADVRATMDACTRATGATRFVVFGLCSGADNGLAAAVADPRIVGVIALDPPTYATRWSHARKLAARAEREGLPAMVAWGVGAVVRRLRTRRDAAADDGQRREIPPVAAHAAQLTALCDRGVAILAVYSGVHSQRYNHADQVFEFAPAVRGRLERAYFPDANHSFGERAAQAMLCDTVVSWLERHFR
jgi:pimeloyl-ACP methyl ester carboxylesterase